MTHLASFMQLTKAEAHEEHGIDAAKHARQLFLIYLHGPNTCCVHCHSYCPEHTVQYAF